MEKTTHFFTDLPQELSLQIINNLSDKALIKTFLQPIYHSGRKLALQIIFLRDTVIARQFQENWLRAVLIEDRLSDYKDVFTKRLMQRALISQNISANLRILLLGTKLILSNSLKEASIKALRFFADFETQEVTGDLILILSKLIQTNILNTIGANHSLPFAQELIIIQLRIKQLKLLKQEDEIIKLCLTYLSLNKISDKQIKIILTTVTNCLSQPGLLSLIKTLLADQRHRYDENTIHLIKKCDVCFDDLVKHGIFEILNSHSKESYMSQKIFNILLNKTLNLLNFEAVFSYLFAKKSNVQFFFSDFLSASCELLATQESKLIKSRVAQLIWEYIEKDIKIIDILSKKTVKKYSMFLPDESLVHYFEYLLKHNQPTLAVELLSDCWYPQAIQRGFLLLEQVIDNLQNDSAEEVSKVYRFLQAFADKNLPERVVAADPSLPTTKTTLSNKISDFLWGIDKNIILQDKLTSSGVVKLLDHLLLFLPQALAKHCGDLVLKIIFSQSEHSYYHYTDGKLLEKIVKNNFFTLNISPYLFELLKKSELIDSLASYLEEPYVDKLFQTAVNALSENKTIPNLFKFCQLAITRLSLEQIEPFWLQLTEQLNDNKKFEFYFTFSESAFNAKKVSKNIMKKVFDIVISQENPNKYSLKLLMLALEVVKTYDFKEVFNFITKFNNNDYDQRDQKIIFLIIEKLFNSSSCDISLVLERFNNGFSTATQYFDQFIYTSILSLVVPKLDHEVKIELLNNLKMQANKANIKQTALLNLTKIILESIKQSLDKQNLIATITVLSDHKYEFLDTDFFEKAKLLVDEQMSEELINYLFDSQLHDEPNIINLRNLKNVLFELVQLVSKNYLAAQLPLWLQSDKNIVQELGIKTLAYLIENKSSIIIADVAKYIDYCFNNLLSEEKMLEFINSKEEYKELKEKNEGNANVKWRRDIRNQSSANVLNLANIIKDSNLEQALVSLDQKENVAWRRESSSFGSTSRYGGNTIPKNNNLFGLLKLMPLINVKDYAYYLTHYYQLLKNNSKISQVLGLYQLNRLISQLDDNIDKSLYPLCINLLKAMFFLFKESNLALKANAVKIYALILSKLNLKTASDFIKKLIGSEIPGVRRSSIFVIYFYFKEVEKQPTFDILLNILIDDVMKLIIDANFTVRKTISEEIGYITQFFNESTLITFLNNLINYHAQYKANEGIKKTVAITLHAALTELASDNLVSALNYLLTQKNEELNLVSYKVINKKFWKNTITYTVQDLLNARARGTHAKELRAKFNVETKWHLFQIELNYAWIKYVADDVDNLKVLPVTSILVNFEAEHQLLLNIKNAIYRQISPSKVESRFAFLQLLSRTPNKHLLKVIANIEAELFANLALSEALLCFDKISNTSIFIDYLAKNYMNWTEANLDKITDVLLEKFTAESFITIFSHLPSAFIHKIVNECIQSYDMTDRYTLITLALPYLRADYSKQLFASLLKETNFNLSYDAKTILLSLATQLFINEDFEPFQHLESAQDSQIMVQLFDSLQTSEQLNCLKK